MEVEDMRERVKKRRRRASEVTAREGGIGGQRRRCHSAPSSPFKISSCSSNESTSNTQREIHVVEGDTDTTVISECSIQRRIAREEAEEEKKKWGAEVEEFLSTAERKQAQHFSSKYNYDVVNDAPLVGRYEWVPLTP